MLVFLYDQQVISAISRKEEMTDETCLITEQEREMIEQTLYDKGHFWRIDKYTVGCSGKQPTENHKWNDEKHYWEIDDELVKQNLGQKRAELWEIIKQKRLDATRTGVEVTLADGRVRHFHTDQVARQEYDGMGVTIVLGAFEERQWKTIENDWITLTLDNFKLLVNAIKNKIDHDYRNAEILKAQINKSEKPETVDLNQGWSISYV
nr:MAG TPA: protein of unknown function (DUF4376) [Caudoviricetes sp.]